MFMLGTVPDWRPVRAGLWLSQFGLLGLVPALAWHAGYLAAACTTLIIAGMIISAWALKQTLRTRKKRQLDPGVKGFLRGLGGLVGAAVVGLLLVWPTTPWSSAPGGFSAMVYIVILFVAGLLPVITGMMCKIVPFLTWMRAYGPKVGHVPTPPAGALANPRLERWALAIQGASAAPLLIGVWRLNTPLLCAGAWMLAAGVVLFLFDMFGILKHLWWPTSGAPVTLEKRSPS
jgi:hypothetical protein